MEKKTEKNVGNIFFKKNNIISEFFIFPAGQIKIKKMPFFLATSFHARDVPRSFFPFYSFSLHFLQRCCCEADWRVRQVSRRKRRENAWRWHKKSFPENSSAQNSKYGNENLSETYNFDVYPLFHYFCSIVFSNLHVWASELSGRDAVALLSKKPPKLWDSDCGSRITECFPPIVATGCLPWNPPSPSLSLKKGIKFGISISFPLFFFTTSPKLLSK